jgi:hypothetical protein
MKKLCLILIITISTLITNAQDGIARYIITDSADTFISVYNSSFDVRKPLVDTLYNIINNEPRIGNYIFIINKSIVYGEMFIQKGLTYNLYDFYVNYIQHPDGSIYRATRFEKPQGPINYNKY